MTGDITVTRVADLKIFEPPCECTDCQTGYYMIEEQYHPALAYRGKVSDIAAEVLARTYVKNAAEGRDRLTQQLQRHADILMNRWRKKGQAKRQQLLKEAVPNLEYGQWIIMRYSYMEERKVNRSRSKTRRQQLLLPWLSVEALKSNPAVLFALLHFRTLYPPQDWAAFDCRQFELSWACGHFDVEFSPKCMVMHGSRYGEIVDWNERSAHRADILGFPRAHLLVEAQWCLIDMLEKIVNKILEGIDDSTPNQVEKWRMMTNGGFKRNGDIELWSPYTHQAFSAPPSFDIDYLISLAKTRLDVMGDHLADLQCDPKYMRHYIKGVMTSSYYKASDERNKAAFLATTIHFNIESYHWWRWIELECQHMKRVHNRFKDEIHPGHALPQEYDLALGALELFLVNQVLYRAACVERLLPSVPGLSKHWKVVGNPSEDNLIIRRGTSTNTIESFEADPLDWCLVQMLGKPDNQTHHDHANLFAFLQDHLANSTAKESSRIDARLMQSLSDLSTAHEMLVSVRLHRPQNKARDLTQVVIEESREGWKRMSGKTKRHPTIYLQKAGSLLLGEYHTSNFAPATNTSKWLEETRTMRTHLAEFWTSMREIVRQDFTDTSFTSEEVKSLLEVITLNLRPEYLTEVLNEETHIQNSNLQTATQQSPPTTTTPSIPHLPQNTTHTLPPHPRREKQKTRDQTRTTHPQSPNLNPPVHPPTSTTTPQISIPPQTFHIFMKMFPSAKTPDSSREVAWTEFVRAMCDAGFTARHNGGSAVLFEGNGELRGRIVFHRPHPGEKIDLVMLRSMGKRMGKWFGWGRGVFVMRG